MIDWVAIPGRGFPMGIDPAREYPPDEDEDEDETPRRVVSVAGFRIGRTPVTDDDGLSLTYVSRADAEEFCSANGVQLPTEAEWEAAARGGDDRLWPWGDEVPDTTRATFGRGSAGRRRSGCTRREPHPAGHWTWRATSSSGRRRRHARRLVPERAGRAALLGALLRGGSFASPGLAWASCTMRSHSRPVRRQAHVGFRVARRR